jgi:DNA gyrase subunit A
MEDTKEQIIQTEYAEIMQKSYIDYAMSVIVSRALPDVRDGLKPVQRRTLYDMYELGLRNERPYRKSARIVGDTMGKYHPHGDSSIYGALVVMAQDFKNSVPLVDGHGNFGSIEGDGAAAMRYTEARLQKITQEVYLGDLDQDVVTFVPNFDATEKEPSVLPVRVPNLLVNGAEGIAVGMATSVPPHNLGEVIDGVIAYMKHPDITVREMLEIIPGPDFPTGGIVANKSDLEQIYTTGKGKIRLRGKVETEQLKGGRQNLVITEIPYPMVGANIGKFLNDVYHLAESKKTTDILDISNQSSKDGIRIVIELRRGADAENLCNLLYKKTRLEDTFGVNMLAVADGRPETLGLLDVIRHHVNFQYDMNTRKYQNLLRKELDQKEIQEGLIKAVDVIDLIIEILRGSKDMKQAKNCLINGVTEGIRFRVKAHEKEAKALKFTERQATAILQMRLYRLIGLELEALEAEHKETLEKIAFYNKVLGSRAEMAKVIIKDLKKIRKEYAVPRKTVIEDLDETSYREEGPKEMEVTFLMDRFGYVRTIDKAAYERNREAADKNHRCVLPCMNTDRIMIFTNRGNMHMLKVMDLPFGKFRDKGTPVDNLTNYSSAQEEILFVGCLNEFRKKKLLFVTRNGMIKLVDGSEFDVSKRTTAATKLSEDDELLYAGAVEEGDSLVLQSDRNYFLRINAMDIPEKKKTAIGVRGMKTEETEKLTAAYLVRTDDIQTVRIKDREVNLNRLHLSRRDTRGTRR